MAVSGQGRAAETVRGCREPSRPHGPQGSVQACPCRPDACLGQQTHTPFSFHRQTFEEGSGVWGTLQPE